MRMISITDGYNQRKRIGELRGSTFRMIKRKDKHFLRNLSAWAVDKNAFDEHQEALTFIVEEEESGIHYIAARSVFLEHGKEIQYGGHGKQIALPLKHWTVFKI